MHRLPISHLVTVTLTHRCCWKKQGPIFLENGLVEFTAICGKYLSSMLWVEGSRRGLTGSFQGKRPGRGRMWSCWFRSGPPSLFFWVSRQPQGPTWWTHGSRMSCHTRSALPAFIKALGDFQNWSYGAISLNHSSNTLLKLSDKWRVASGIFGLACFTWSLKWKGEPGSLAQLSPEGWNQANWAHLSSRHSPDLWFYNFPSFPQGMNCVLLNWLVWWELNVRW
jgi:hypothetical protein